MNTLDRLDRVFKTILEEARKSPEFAERLALALDVDKAPHPSRRHRRTPPVLDPLQLYSDGEDCLREGLTGLSIEQLKDIVAEYGMDTQKLAMRWKKRERLEGLILDTVQARLAKGAAFRDHPAASGG